MIRTREGFNSIVGKLLKRIWTNYSAEAIYAADGFRMEFGQNVIWCAVFKDEHLDSTYLHFYKTCNNEIDDRPQFYIAVPLIKGIKPSLDEVCSYSDLVATLAGDFCYFVQESCKVMVKECTSRSIYYGGTKEPWCELTIYYPDVPDTWEDERLSHFAV